MMKGLFRKVLAIGIMVLFVGVIGLAFFKGNMVAYASGTIYIRADGLVEGTDKISNDNNVTYTFTDDINDSIVIERSNIIVDGDGYMLNGSWSLMNGFNLTSVSNVTVMNVNMVEFGYAMWLEGASQCVVSNNTCVDNEGGIWLVSSVGNTVSGNTVVRSVEGVALDSSSGNNITGNDIMDSYNYGVYIRNNSADNTISGNYIKGTVNGAGIYLSGSPDNVILGNDIRDSPNEHICLLSASNNNIISGNTLTNSTADVGVYVYGCSLNNFFGNNITRNADSSIRFDLSSDSTVSENNISENWNGVYLWYSSNITVSGNDITANIAYGVLLDNSGSNIVEGNNITDNSLIAGGSGIALSLSSNNVLSGNNIISNNYWGINPGSSNNNTISGNNIISNNVGINFASSNFSIVSANNIIDNVYSGIYLESSSNNTFHHNNFINNTNQVVVDEPGYANNWDDGYPSGGNYWSEYTDVDDNSGPSQNITGVSDGIWDHPYVIDVNNTDYYPLTLPYDGQPPVITNVVQDPLTDITPDTVVKINATVTDAMSGVKQVLLNCTFTNATDTWYEVFSMTHLVGDVWNATILPYPYGTNATYVIIAEDNAGNNITTEQIYGYKYEYQIIPEYPLATILVAFMTATTLLIATVSRKKRHFMKQNRPKHSY
jgi:parallel beta-helix repeat protein